MGHAAPTRRLIRRIAPGGVVTTFAGTATPYAFPSGVATSFGLKLPASVARDAAGNLYIADAGTFVIRIVSAAGVMSVLAGRIGVSGVVDGTGTSAGFGSPVALALDGTGSNLFIVDALGTSSGVICKLSIASATVTTFAGAVKSTALSCAGTSASFASPFATVLDTSGNVYVADTGNNFIRRIDAATSVVTIFAGGSSINSGYVDGPLAWALYSGPTCLALDAAGAVMYVVDSSSSLVRKIILSNATVSTLAGGVGRTSSGFLDAVGTAALFNYPVGCALVGSALYVGDTSNHAVRRVDVNTGAVTTLAGAGGPSGAVDGLGTAARFYNPEGLAAAGTTALYVADKSNNLIRVVNLTTGSVTTVAGGNGGTSGGSQNGRGTAATFNNPRGVAVDASGVVYIAGAPPCPVLPPVPARLHA
jgi:hypothetical protein